MKAKYNLYMKGKKVAHSLSEKSADKIAKVYSKNYNCIVLKVKES